MSRTGSFPWTVWKIFFSFILSPLLFLPHSSEYQAVSFFFFLTMTQDLYNRDKFFFFNPPGPMLKQISHRSE
jgi:hypothetical protein